MFIELSGNTLITSKELECQLHDCMRCERVQGVNCSWQGPRPTDPGQVSQA